MAEPSTWPGVVADAIERVPVEHFPAAFWVLLAVVVMVAIPFLQKLIRPAQSSAEVEEAVARGVARVVNGDLKEIRNQLHDVKREMSRIDSHIGRLEHVVEINRRAAKEWHEENSVRLDRYDRVINSLKPWDGRSDRRQPR